MEILEITFQANHLQPWFANVRKQLVKSPKFYLNDSASVCQLFSIDTVKQLAEHPMVGAIFETWVWAEIRKLLVFQFGIQAFFYRTHAGKEVDFILQKGERYCAIEVKWSEKITLSDFNALKDFQKTVDCPVRSIVLYTGREVLRFSEDCFALPIHCLL